MEPQQEQVKTDISIEESSAPVKGKKRAWWLIALVAVLILVAAGALFRALHRPDAPSHQPTDEELQQLKYDSEQKEREQQKAAQIKDQAFLVRKEDDSQAELNSLLKDLDLRKNSGSLPPAQLDDRQVKSEEEAIAHILRSSKPARAPSAPTITEAPRRTAPPPQTPVAADSSSMGPMFVYSRIYGGAKYVDDALKQTNKTEAIPASDSSAITVEANEENDPKVDQAPEEKAQLIYTNYPSVTLYEGEMLEAVLVNRIIADTEPSPVICHLARDLFDHSARYVVIPANSRIVGTSQVVNYKGAHRLFVNFSRIILPNGPSIDLPSSRKAMKALDETGALGVVSKVERHWFLQFGTSIFFGMLDGLAGAVQRNQDFYSSRAVVLGRTSENFGRILDNIMAQYSTIVPTIRVDQGKTMKIYLSDDIVISPYAEIADRSYYASR
jgi:type IV secretory pathway VirB10-like protein